MNIPQGLPLTHILAAYGRKGYLYQEDGLPYCLNIFGVRSSEGRPNKFDDFIGVSYNDKKTHKVKFFKATTDPGTYWLKNPMSPLGTAILKPGQYEDCWKLGLHKGYEALQQIAPVIVYRDNNRNDRADTKGMKEERGLFGINIHRANAKLESIQIDKWSAGCQVIASPVTFAFLIDLCRKSRQHRINRFTYSLFTEEEFFSG